MRLLVQGPVRTLALLETPDRVFPRGFWQSCFYCSHLIMSNNRYCEWSKSLKGVEFKRDGITAVERDFKCIEIWNAGI